MPNNVPEIKINQSINHIKGRKLPGRLVSWSTPGSFVEASSRSSSETMAGPNPWRQPTLPPPSRCVKRRCQTRSSWSDATVLDAYALTTTTTTSRKLHPSSISIIDDFEGKFRANILPIVLYTYTAPSMQLIRKPKEIMHLLLSSLKYPNWATVHTLLLKFTIHKQ